MDELNGLPLGVIMRGFLSDFQGILSFSLNLLQLITIIIAVGTFFFLMINKYSKALKKILAPCGLGFWQKIRCMFICRKSQIKKRALIEYCILMTKGCPVIKSEWRTIINSFKSFYIENEQGNLKYIIPNCTSLIDKDFSDATARYFEYFSQEDVKKAFGIQDDKLFWVIKIHIEEAYATPTCLLTGLLSQYDESWEEFIKRYVSTAYMSEDKDNKSQSILSNELYFTFAWLLWGPSYELEYKKYWAGLCQLSYGDESNSIPAIADTETNVAEALQNKFLDNEEHRYGALISADVTIYDKKPFYKSLRSKINPKNTYFYNKIESNDSSFGVKINDFAPCVNYKAKKYYSTAYVWILFALEDDEYIFKPEKSVAFFEHANLANNITYEFLISTLIEKSLKHFEGIYSNPKTADRKYRFVCAMNNKIASECIKKYSEVMNSGTPFGDILKSRIEMKSNYSPDEVFATYDEFFSPSKKLKYTEISFSDPSTISDYARFYAEVYMEAFPDENERESFNSLLKYLKAAENSKDYKYHVILAKDETDKIIVGGIFDYFKHSNSGVIEFIAVQKELQSAGIGTELYNHIVSILSKDAFVETGRSLDFIFCEIDSPEYSKAEVKKYLYFWDKNNYRHIDFNYLQPALSTEQGPVTGLWFTMSALQNSIDSVSSETVLSVIYDYMKYAMSIEDPEKNEWYIQMKKELLEKKTIKLAKIIKE